MSRRRYISTDISLDAKVNQLSRESDFDGLLYTWMIPHAADTALIRGTPDEIMMRVVPGRRDKDVPDIIAALEHMERIGLIRWDRDANVVYFPTGPFYTHQSYIKPENRRAEDGPAGQSSPDQDAAQESSAERNFSLILPESSERPNYSTDSVEKPLPVSSSISISSSISLPVSSSAPPPDETDGDEVDEVLRALRFVEDRTVGSDGATRESILRGIDDYAAFDPVLVALDYARWQNGLSKGRRHRDLVRGWRNQMAMRADQGDHKYRRRAPEMERAWSAPDVDELPPCNTQLWAEIRVLMAGSHPGALRRFDGVADQMQDDALILTFPDDYQRAWAERCADVVNRCATDCGYPDLEIEYAVLGQDARAAG